MTATPRELLEQADTAVELTKVVARYFREPMEPLAVASRSRARASLDAARAAQSALKSRAREPGREDWLTVSRCLAELADDAGRAVAQAKLYGVERRESFSRMALGLRDSAVQLQRALRRKLAAENLAQAKRLASGVDQGARGARKTALEEARAIVGLKDQEVCRRLSDAAQAAHAAAERMAEIVSQGR